jgi:hypothetical protein
VSRKIDHRNRGKLIPGGAPAGKWWLTPNFLRRLSVGVDPNKSSSAAVSMNTLNLRQEAAVSTPPAQAEPVLRDQTFSELNSILKANFYQPDLQAIRIVLGTIKAHYLDIGDPAWLFVVAPPGSGKTTSTIMGASGLREVILLSEFTENTFLSGFHGHVQPGLLEKLGTPSQTGSTIETIGNAIFLAKDFTTVLSMRREKRAVILGQLREIHDGTFKRAFGTGVTKAWKGRVTIIAAVTPVLDRHYSIFSVLGERFLQVRWHRPDSAEAGEWAIRQQGQEAEIQRQVREAIERIFSDSVESAPALAVAMRTRIASLAEIIALGRTHVFRDSWNRDIEYVPESEANTRVSKGLAAIARGVAALNRRTEVAEPDLQDAFRVGLDCLPENRRRILLAIVKGQEASSVSLARTVYDREVEDLRALQILTEDKTDSPKLTGYVQRLLEASGLRLA